MSSTEGVDYDGGGLHTRLSLICCLNCSIITMFHANDISVEISHVEKSEMCTFFQFKQEALLLQRDCTRHLSLEILQLQNTPLENPIVWHYLRDVTFSRFDTIPECDRHTHRQTVRHTTTAYTALSIASHVKNRPYCTDHQL